MEQVRLLGLDEALHRLDGVDRWHVRFIHHWTEFKAVTGIVALELCSFLTCLRGLSTLRLILLYRFRTCARGIIYSQWVRTSLTLNELGGCGPLFLGFVIIIFFSIVFISIVVIIPIVPTAII